jgi:hypothetical protein
MFVSKPLYLKISSTCEISCWGGSSDTNHDKLIATKTLLWRESAVGVQQLYPLSVTRIARSGKANDTNLTKRSSKNNRESWHLFGHSNVAFDIVSRVLHFIMNSHNSAAHEKFESEGIKLVDKRWPLLDL